MWKTEYLENFVCEINTRRLSVVAFVLQHAVLEVTYCSWRSRCSQFAVLGSYHRALVVDTFGSGLLHLVAHCIKNRCMMSGRTLMWFCERFRGWPPSAVCLCTPRLRMSARRTDSRSTWLVSCMSRQLCSSRSYEWESSCRSAEGWVAWLGSHKAASYQLLSLHSKLTL